MCHVLKLCCLLTAAVRLSLRSRVRKDLDECQRELHVSDVGTVPDHIDIRPREMRLDLGPEGALNAGVLFDLEICSCTKKGYSLLRLGLSHQASSTSSRSRSGSRSSMRSSSSTSSSSSISSRGNSSRGVAIVAEVSQ